MTTSTNDELLASHFSDTVLAKAKDDRVSEDRDGVYWVDTPSGSHYRVQVIVSDDRVYVICNCRNGKEVGDWPYCHHAAAALDWLLSKAR